MRAGIRLVPPLGGKPSGGASRRTRYAPALSGRRGLVCAGGGITGAIYEMGALAALEERIEGSSLVDFDVFIGVSAGSFVSTLVSNGVSPSVLYRLVTRAADSRSDLDDLSLFRLNTREIAGRLAAAPITFVEAAWDFFRNPYETTLTDLIASVAGVLPSGFFVLDGMEEWLEAWLSQPGRTNDFRALGKRLRIVAVEVDTGRTTAFGEPGFDRVPISRAVTASCALPLVYRPVAIDGVDYIDGGVKKTAHISLALKERCGLILCVNPIVPIRFPEGHTGLLRRHAELGALAGKGLLSVLDQVFRLTLHSRLQYGLDRYRRENPDADILVFEPRSEDLPRIMRNIMRTSGRAAIAEYAYRCTMRQLDQESPDLSRVFERHGLHLRPATPFDGNHARERQAEGALLSAHGRLLASLETLDRSLGSPGRRPA